MKVTWRVKAWRCKCEIFKTSRNFLKLKMCLSNELTLNNDSLLAANDHFLSEIRPRRHRRGRDLAPLSHLTFAGANQNKVVMKTWSVWSADTLTCMSVLGDITVFVFFCCAVMMVFTYDEHLSNITLIKSADVNQCLTELYIMIPPSYLSFFVTV